MNYIYPIGMTNGQPDLKKFEVIGYKSMAAAEELLRKLNAAALPPLAVGAIHVEAPDRRQADDIADLFIGTSQYLLLKEGGS